MSGYTAPRCGRLRASDAGREVDLYGWVARRRDHGGLVFIDLRDRYGITQVVFEPEQGDAVGGHVHEVRGEFVVRVPGTVRARPDGTVNDTLATGEVEVAATGLEILNKSKTPPFPIEDEQNEADEKTRLKYRYLDLRRQPMLRALEIRHRLNKIIHRVMDDNEFIEVETPILMKSTPEGARDFLVPSRLHQGEFFALPQSPQTLKQLLMVAGVQRYYQIAHCIRDEDLRADRQPEFTQLDLEMSFNDEEDIFELAEDLFSQVWKEILGVELARPWPRMSMKDALLRYGTDKPDLRYELEIADLGEVLANTQAQVFRSALEDGGVVRGFAVPGGQDLARRELEELATIARGAGGKGLAWLPGPLEKFLSEAEMAGIRSATGATDGDLILVAADRRR